MIGYVLWMAAGVLLGVWLAPSVQAAKAALYRRLQEVDALQQDAPNVRDDDRRRQ